jgi:hypothetical protein
MDAWQSFICGLCPENGFRGDDILTSLENLGLSLTGKTCYYRPLYGIQEKQAVIMGVDELVRLDGSMIQMVIFENGHRAPLREVWFSRADKDLTGEHPDSDSNDGSSAINAFIVDCCEIGSSFEVSSAELYKEFSKIGHSGYSPKRFNTVIKPRFAYVLRRGVGYFTGVRIKA